MRRSLAAAIGTAVLAFASFAAAAFIGSIRWWAWLGLLLALAAWLQVLLPWYRRHATMTPAQHQRGMYAALAAWAVTDIAVILAFAL